MAPVETKQLVILLPKNVGLAVVLTIFFGPIGMFYSTVAGAITMMVLYPIVGLLTFGLGLIILHPIAIVWAALKANSFNKKLIAPVKGTKESKDLPAEQPRTPTTNPDKLAQPEFAQSTTGENKFVESAKIQGLVLRARQMEAKNDKDSSNQARLLWEEALRMGGLSSADELLCHYHLGTFYSAAKNIDNAIQHYQLVIMADPRLGFLTDVDEMSKGPLIANMYLALSAAYQGRARQAAGDKQGIKGAIAYLQDKANLLGNMATPSLLYDLGSLYKMSGDRKRFEDTMRLAQVAPTFSTEAQEKAKEMAVNAMTQDEHPANSLGNRFEAAPIIQSAIPVPNPKTNKVKTYALIGGGVSIVASAVVLAILFILPRQYKEYLRKAQEYYKIGDFSTALTFVQLAKEEKASPEVANLENDVRNSIKAREIQAERQKRDQEYVANIERARSAFRQGRYAEANSYAQAARALMSSPEATTLLRDIHSAMVRTKREEDNRAQVMADDAAFRLASQLDTELSYAEYLRTYPEGRNRSVVINRMFYLRDLNAQNQNAAGLSQTQIPQPAGTALPPQASDYWNDLKRELQGAVASLELRTSSKPSYSRNYQEQQRIRQAWRSALNRSLSGANNSLIRAMEIAKKMTNREPLSLISKWESDLQRIRRQMTFIGGEEESFRMQKTLISEIRNYSSR